GEGGMPPGPPESLRARVRKPKRACLPEISRFSNPQGEVGSMLDQEDELHLLGFLATLAGLLGIVVGVSQFQVGSASSATVRAYFSLLLVVFLFCGRARVSRRVAGSGCRLVQLGRARPFLRPPRVRGRTRSREPPPGRRSIWRILGDRHHRCPLLLYWTLQRWHRKLDWGPGSR